MRRIYANDTEYFMSNERTHRQLLQLTKDVITRRNCITYISAQ